MSDLGSTVRPFSVERRRTFPRPPSIKHVADADVADGVEGLLESLRAEIRDLREELAAHRRAPGAPAAGAEPDRDIRLEVARMVREIGRAKREISAIRHPMGDEDHVAAASRQLEAIVATTETATNDIMSAVDSVDDILKRIRSLHSDDPDLADAVESGSGHLIRVIEACSFQDLTGQRVAQVVQVLRFIEQRILAIIDIWGLDAFQDLPIEETEQAAADEHLLNGPALAGQGLSQQDIDALFD